MVLLKMNHSVTIDLQVLAGAHEVILCYGPPAATEMDPGLAQYHVDCEARLTMDAAQRLLKTLGERLPISLRVRDAGLELLGEDQRAHFVRDLNEAIQAASRTILEIDSPLALLKPWQQQRGEHFCTWPVRFGGRFVGRFPNRIDDIAREIVEFEFYSVNFGSRPVDAFDFTRTFFAEKWRDSCVGQSVLITLRNTTRQVTHAEQVIGSRHRDVSAVLVR